MRFTGSSHTITSHGPSGVTSSLTSVSPSRTGVGVAVAPRLARTSSAPAAALPAIGSLIAVETLELVPGRRSSSRDHTAGRDVLGCAFDDRDALRRRTLVALTLLVLDDVAGTELVLPLDLRGVHEDVTATLRGLEEAETSLGVEDLHTALGHEHPLLSGSDCGRAPTGYGASRRWTTHGPGAVPLAITQLRVLPLTLVDESLGGLEAFGEALLLDVQGLQAFAEGS